MALKCQNPDYYWLVNEVGREAVHTNKDYYGDILYRPVDKRENYVKRCVGMPGDSLAIRNNALYINGEKQKDPARMQLCYFVETDGAMLTEEQFRKMDINKSDRKFVSVPTSDEEKFYYEYLPFVGFTSVDGRYNPIYRLPLTQEALEMMKKIRSVKQIKVEPEQLGGSTYPVGYRTGWTRDNYGPIWIPKKGATIELNERNLALYSRCIGSYEENKLEVRLLLDDGRQSTQQCRQSFVGFRARRSYRREADPHLALARQRPEPLQWRHPLESDVPHGTLRLIKNAAW